jgi:hypothetical protein
VRYEGVIARSRGSECYEKQRRKMFQLPPERTQVSPCTSQSSHEPKQGSTPRRHGSAEGAGPNAALAIVQRPHVCEEVKENSVVIM